MKILFFGKNLKFLRHKIEAKQSEMLNRIGFKRTTWNGYEHQKSFPKFEDLLKIADYFDISLDELVFEDLQKARFGQKSHEEKKQKKGKVWGKVEGKVYPQKQQNISIAAEEREEYYAGSKIEQKLYNYITFLEGRVKELEVDVSQLQQTLEGFRATKNV